MSVANGMIGAMTETELHCAAARVLEIWGHLDSPAEFINDNLMPQMREAMAELEAAVFATHSIVVFKRTPTACRP
jgi:hypothetical protein